MSFRPHMTTRIRKTCIALAFGLATAGAQAQSASPFANLSGEWSGSGTIELAGGTREPIKCRAAYDVLDRRNNLQLNIRCASDSYNFDLRASATLAANSVSGSWSEATRNASGSISGTAKGEHIDVIAESPSFTAGLSLVTRGSRQSVVIRPKDPSSSIRGANINLRRS